MVFSSIPFLFYFMPFILVVYFMVSHKYKNLVLFLGSTLFYAWGEPKNVLIMLICVLVGYLGGILIEQADENRNNENKNKSNKDKNKKQRLYLILSSTFMLMFLVYFKYIDFVIKSVNAAFGTSISLVGVILPIGVSFYTFQILSYLVDVYRGDVKVQKNFIDFATYVMLFPQLIAGPIVRYVDIAAQLTSRGHSVERVYLGLRRFLFGLSKKVLLADQFGALCEIFFNMQNKTVLFYWMYAIAFTLQIYFDFSGYSDMAIGLGKILGFSFLENFNYPFISESITEFWRRWHMSLGFWFRDYVYIPLGGNRVSKWKWLRNIFVVWMLTGLWHGASWNFIWWGLLFGVVLVLEKIWFARVLKKLPRLFRHIYVMLIVIISFVIFQAVNMKTAVEDIAGMFGMQGGATSNLVTNYYFKSYGFTLLLGIVGCTPIPKIIVTRIQKSSCGKKIISVIEPVFLCILLLIVTARLVDGSFQPFLYFRF